MSDDEFDDAMDPDLPEYQRLTKIAKFSHYIRKVPWLSRLATPLTAEDNADAEAYLVALGFPDAGISLVDNWAEAADFAENPDWNTDWWEAEEQLRSGLVAQATEDIDEADLSNVLNHVAAQAGAVAAGAANAAAAKAGYEDESFITATAGTIVAACYTAGLVLAAGADEDHPFTLKFRLLETGRFPLGVVGSTFSLF